MKLFENVGGNQFKLVTEESNSTFSQWIFSNGSVSPKFMESENRNFAKSLDWAKSFIEKKRNVKLDIKLVGDLLKETDAEGMVDVIVTPNEGIIVNNNIPISKNSKIYQTIVMLSKKYKTKYGIRWNEDVTEIGK